MAYYDIVHWPEQMTKAMNHRSTMIRGLVTMELRKQPLAYENISLKETKEFIWIPCTEKALRLSRNRSKENSIRKAEVW